MLLDIFITDPIAIDFPVFHLWLEGSKAKEAAVRRHLHVPM